MRKMDRTS